MRPLHPGRICGEFQLSNQSSKELLERGSRPGLDISTFQHFNIPTFFVPFPLFTFSVLS